MTRPIDLVVTDSVGQSIEVRADHSMPSRRCVVHAEPAVTLCVARAREVRDWLDAWIAAAEVSGPVGVGFHPGVGRASEAVS